MTTHSDPIVPGPGPDLQRRRTGLSILLLLTVGALLTASVYAMLNQARDELLRDQARVSASRLASFFADHVPGLPRAFETGTVGAAQRVAIARGAQVGDIFRFKMFMPGGELFFTSDTRSLPDAAPEDLEEPRSVAATGLPIISLKDGTATADRPDRYAEVYHPVLGSDGRVIGVIEIYADQTELYALVTATFRRLTLLVPAFVLVVFLLPSIALAVVHYQKRRGDGELEQARIDALTGALTRTELDRAATDVFAGPPARPIGVLFVDIDHFKQLNDSRGHAAGDRHLVRVVQHLRGAVRRGDIIGRFGGDEFVVIMPDATVDGMSARLDGVHERLSRELGPDASGSLSIGAAVVDSGVGYQAALLAADQALYEAKRAGRARTVFHNRHSREEGESAAPPLPQARSA